MERAVAYVGWHGGMITMDGREGSRGGVMGSVFFFPFPFPSSSFFSSFPTHATAAATAAPQCSVFSVQWAGVVGGWLAGGSVFVQCSGCWLVVLFYYKFLFKLPLLPLLLLVLSVV